MYKKVFLTLILILSSNLIFSQSSIIFALREVIKDAPSNFSLTKGEFVKKEGEFNYYKAIESPGATAVVIETPTTEKFEYYRIYNLEPGDETYDLKITVMKQYIEELNLMVKSGNYNGEDFKDGDYLVTRITDKNNNKIVDLQSNFQAKDSVFLIVVYGK